ncbi:DUF4231 domain-containing protein [Kitasatospora sp. NPDC088134]|uniref:DUF4231 domain-containing protein n=1 Tax=Kitasatospora sp. NPDC088134 TaxID=3364071 RepID=UPI00380E2CB4
MVGVSVEPVGRTVSEASASGGQMEVGLAPVEAAERLLGKIRSGAAYARARKERFRRSSSLLRVLTLALSAASTIILGLQDLDFWAGLGFALVAVVTLLGAVESFFNWRSRWVLMEETQSRFRRLGDDLEQLVATTSAAELSHEHLRPLYEEYRRTWSDLSDRWLQERRAAGPAGSSAGQ